MSAESDGSQSGSLGAESLNVGASLGSYSISRRFSHGLAGALYAARHLEQGEDVTLLVLPQAVAKRPKIEEQLTLLLKKLAVVSHPAFLKAERFERVGDRLCLVYEPLKDAVSVAEYYKEHFKEEAQARQDQEQAQEALPADVKAHSSAPFPVSKHFPLPVSETSPILKSVASALKVAHEAGIHHLDLIPENLFLTEGGQLKIAGFGILEQIDDETFENLVSAAVAPIKVESDFVKLETIDLRPPEVQRGSRPNMQTDIYGFGVLAFYLFTGMKPPSTTPPPSNFNREVPDGWDAVVERCLAMIPEERYPTTGLLNTHAQNAERLKAMLEEDSRTKKPVSIERVPLPGMLERRISRGMARGLRVGMLLVVAALILLTAKMFLTILVADTSDDGIPQGAVVEVDSSRAASVIVRSEPRQVKVSLRGEGRGEFIVLDGVLHAAAPPGRYRLTVEAPHHRPVSQIIQVAEDQTQEYSFELETMWARGTLRSTPGAHIVVRDEKDRRFEVGRIGEDGVFDFSQRLFAGDYSFIITHPDYEELVFEQTLSADEPVNIDRSMTPLPSSLIVQSEPQGATVFINDKEVGKTPVTAEELSVGEPLTVRLELSGYRIWSTEVALAPNEKRRLDAEALHPLEGRVRLELLVNGEPLSEKEMQALQVSVEGESVEMSEGMVPAPQGRPEIRVVHPDYFPLTESLRVEDRRISTFRAALVARPGKLVVEPKPNVPLRVMVDGKAVEQEDSGAFLIPSQTTQKVHISARNFYVASLDMEFDPNEKRTLPLTLKPLPGPEFGEPYSIPYVNLELLPVSSGTYTMGSPREESARLPNEGPETTVTLTNAFWVGTHEVTQREYEAVTGKNPSYFKAPANPVENLTWNEAVAFTERLTRLEKEAGRLPEGYVYRLPTQAEWEYACRAGTQTPFFFGSEATPADGNFKGVYPRDFDERLRNEEEKYGPQNVGRYAANDWGFYDMHGNVAEWTLDVFNDRLPGGSVTDWIQEGRTGDRPVRGGGWSDFAPRCRSAARDRLMPTTESNAVGFRVALAPKQR